MKKYLVFFLLIFSFINFTFINIPFVKALPVISYNAGTNIITVTGFTLILPCTFFDIWSASITGGWGVVTQSIGTIEQYLFDCRLIIGDGNTETHFADNNTQIIFSNISVSANAQFLIDVKAKAHFTLGVLIDETNKTTTDGVSIFLSNTPYQFLRLISGTSLNSHIFLYSSQLINTDNVRCYFYIRGNSSEYSRFWNTQFYNLDSIWLEYADYYNVVWADSNLGGLASTAFSARGLVTINDLKAYRNSIVFFPSANLPFSVSNMYIRDTINYLMRVTSKVISVNNRPQLINIDSDIWLFHWLPSGLSIDNMVFRQYEYDLTVIYPNGTVINGTETDTRVEIQHYGNNGAIDYNATLNENGTINTTVLTMGFYNQTGGNNIYSYNPFNLRIYNTEGFIEYNGNFTLNKKEDLTIILTSSDIINYDIPIALIISFGLIISMLVIAKIKWR